MDRYVVPGSGLDRRIRSDRIVSWTVRPAVRAICYRRAASFLFFSFLAHGTCAMAGAGSIVGSCLMARPGPGFENVSQRGVNPTRGEEMLSR